MRDVRTFYIVADTLDVRADSRAEEIARLRLAASTSDVRARLRPSGISFAWFCQALYIRYADSPCERDVEPFALFLFRHAQADDHVGDLVRDVRDDTPVQTIVMPTAFAWISSCAM